MKPIIDGPTGIWEVLRVVDEPAAVRGCRHLLYEVRCRRCGAVARRTAMDVRRNGTRSAIPRCGSCRGRSLFRGTMTHHSEIVRISGVSWERISARTKRGLSVDDAVVDADLLTKSGGSGSTAYNPPGPGRECISCHRDLPRSAFGTSKKGRQKNKSCRDCLDARRARLLADPPRPATRRVVRYEVLGKRLTAPEVSRIFGVPADTFRDRVKSGMSPIEAASRPTNRRPPRADGKIECLGCGVLFERPSGSHRSRCGRCGYRKGRGLPDLRDVRTESI